MQILEFSVNKQVITWTNNCRIPVENTRGFVRARFEVDEEWDGLSLIATFRSGAQQAVEVPITGDLVDVPPEVLRRGQLYVGLIGLGDGGNIRLTTKKMTWPIVLFESTPVNGGPPQDITLEAWERALAAIGNLSNLDTSDKSSLVAAINEVRRTGGGSGEGTNGVCFETDETLTLKNGILSVNTANAVEQDNTLPITSAAVHTTVGNIEILLKTI